MSNASMNFSVKTFLSLAAFQALLAVALGAFGAHIVKNIVPLDHLVWWNTAVQYLMYHSLASLVCAWMGQKILTMRYCVLLFTSGNLFFAGSLMTMTLTGTVWLGAITPIGGTLYILGWLLFIWNIRRDTTSS
ncbi:DUF423 domain-containing protein [Marinomonas agarivorans]|nr:DUF423 domain-containing protein [Marinomonas agarivorans]